MVKFDTYKTIDLSHDDKVKICDLFYQTFHIEKKIEYFEKEFTNTCKGYSYHCIYRSDGNILASYCIIPKEYNVKGEKKLLGLSVDTMVSPKAKIGPFGIADMSSLTEQIAKEDGCSIIYGFPNNNFLNTTLKY